ncbi:MAG: mannose-1-phosphate guanylyltransferase/mannose-6-phosphate isomerase [Stenotrophobium sp.]
MSTPLLPVILSGGSGTRLWPLSRENYPKQFLKLIGERTLLQDTALRVQGLGDVLPPLAICGDRHRFIVAEQLLDAGVGGATVMLEPEGRNTAPAAAVAAHYAVEKHGPETVLLLLPSDHVVADARRFHAAVQLAVEAAADGRIVAFGIRPTRAETGYGYIKAGVELASGVRAIASFVEKPDAARAQAFLKDGGYYWNGGIFAFQAQAFLEELRHLEPQMHAATQAAINNSRRDLDFIRLDSAAFKNARADSIDYAVMEKTSRAALVPLDAGWDDVGSWSFLDTLPKDAEGNVARGDVMLADARDNLVHAESRLVTLAGVSNHIVIETQDAVLVTTKDRVQDVKQIVARLKSAKRPEAQEHPQVYRPWGSYETIAMAERFQVKRIIVKPGQKLSLQMHHHRAEHWIVVKGTAQVTCGDKLFLLHEDQSTYIPLGEKHRLENPGAIPLVLIEVQSGAYLGEDDIVRFEDVYGRTPS